MRTTQLIEAAVRNFNSVGEDFFEQLLWHLAHGCVVSRHDCLLLAYYCRSTSIGSPAKERDSDCLYITYYAGSITKLFSTFEWGGKVAFRRAFKLAGREARIYDSSRIKQLFKTNKTKSWAEQA
jgi:hypothetical protein